MQEIYIYTFQEVVIMLCSAVPLGFLIGVFPMILGLTLDGILRIFKKA